MKVILVFLFIFFSPSIIFAASDGTIINLQVHNCNNNNICEPQYGENIAACPLDCTATSTATSTQRNSIKGSNSLFYDSDVNPLTIKIYFPAYGIAYIEWQTRGFARETLQWGKTSETELGNIAEIEFLQNHNVEISGLEPYTQYFFRIESVDRWGHQSFLNNLSFITPGIVKITPPSNPSTAPKVTDILLLKPLWGSVATTTTLFNLEEGASFWLFYIIHYYVAYFFGFLNFLFSLLIHI